MTYSREGLRRLNAFFQTYYGMQEYKHGWLKGTCPDCGRELKFGVNLLDNRTNCFVCGYHDKPTKAASFILKHDNLGQTLNFLSSYEGLGYFKTEKIVVENLKTYGTISLPEGFRTLLPGNDAVGKAITRYVLSRGLDINTLNYKGFGYCLKGVHFGRLIMPFKYKETLIYYHSRKVVGTSGEKFKNPDIKDNDVGKSLVIYNWDSLFYYNKIYIAESVINAETIGDECTAMGGKHLSAFQVTQLLKSPVSEFVFLLDPDAMDKTINLGYKFLGLKPFKIITFPEGKDVNDLGRDWVIQAEKETPYATQKTLTRLKYERPQYTY